MADANLSRKSGFIPALDVLRLAGLALVTLQHCLTLLGDDAWTRVGGVLVGRLGVAILLAIAGFLALCSSRPPGERIVQRLGRLFPAYWLVLALSVVLTAWSGHRQIDAL